MASRFRAGFGTLAFDDVGPKQAHAIVFIHAMSFDRFIWKDVISLLPSGFRLISFDQRGHGGSDTPPLPYTLEHYISDAIELLDHLHVRDCSLVGVSFGGLVTQGVAKVRPDVVKHLVLSNTATKIGSQDDWMASANEARLNGFSREGIEQSYRNLFGPAFQQSPVLADLIERRLRLSVKGYVGCCHAIGDADLMTIASTLDQPSLVIGTDQDLITPKEVVQKLAATLPNGDFKLITGAGHLPCIEKPQEFAEHMISFFRRHGVV